MDHIAEPGLQKLISKIEEMASDAQIAMHADNLVFDAILRSYGRAGKLAAGELEREVMTVSALPTAAKGGDVAKVVETFRRRTLSLATSIHTIDAARPRRAERLRALHTAALYAVIAVMLALYTI